MCEPQLWPERPCILRWFGQGREIMMLYVRKLEFWVEEGGGRVVHTYSGNRVTIDVLPRGPLTLLIIRSITIKQGIHTDGPENWTHNAMAQLVKQGNPSMMMTMMISLTLFQFLPRSGRSSCPCEGFIASASIGRTVPPHDSIGRPTNLECEGDDENGSGGIISLTTLQQAFKPRRCQC